VKGGGGDMGKGSMEQFQRKKGLGGDLLWRVESMKTHGGRLTEMQDALFSNEMVVNHWGEAYGRKKIKRSGGKIKRVLRENSLSVKIMRAFIRSCRGCVKS